MMKTCLVVDDSITVRRVTPADAAPAVTLLDALRVSLFGVRSARLHRALVADGVAQRIDCRVALAENHLCGVVLAAPRAYWTSALLNHPTVGFECLRARLIARAHADASASAPAALGNRRPVEFDSGNPRRTWADPGDAWRIIFVGTAPAARGRGVAADLYTAVSSRCQSRLVVSSSKLFGTDMPRWRRIAQ